MIWGSKLIMQNYSKYKPWVLECNIQIWVKQVCSHKSKKISFLHWVKKNIFRLHCHSGSSAASQDSFLCLFWSFWLLQPFQHNSKTVGPRKLKFRILKGLVISLIVLQLTRVWHTSKVLPRPFSTTLVPLVVEGWNSGFRKV